MCTLSNFTFYKSEDALNFMRASRDHWQVEVFFLFLTNFRLNIYFQRTIFTIEIEMETNAINVSG